eukprot:m.165565 g.165565  ORF g.165565 m.165565 type:complete len:699 (-) comp12579_c0_seq1:1083-3179(-)
MVRERSRQSVQLLQRPLEVSFQNLSVVVVKTGQTILSDVKGSARSGEVLALMGPTGSGKTTLLSTLAQRNEATLRTFGSIRYGDMHRYQFCKALKPRIGFVEQDDIVVPQLTVRQSLMISAGLRIGKHMTEQEQRNRVEEVISSLRLNKCADSRIGGDGARGISGGERKRLCIGTELLTKPRLLFLDEPTSGLDSSTAETVVNLLKDLAQSDNVTVICSIHQPSSQIFHSFDKLAFLHNGRCIYHGPGGKASVDAFAAAGMMCPKHYNPPDYFMGLATDGTLDDQATQKRLTASIPLDEYTAEALRSHDEDIIVLKEPTSDRYAASFGTQLSKLALRSWLRSKGQKLTAESWVLYGGLALITGLGWLGLKDSESDVFLRSGLALWVLGTWLFFPLIAALSLLGPERALALKELAVGAYRPSAYYIATAALVLPFEFLFCGFYTVIVYLMTFWNYLYIEQLISMILLNYLSIIVFYSIGMLFAAGVPARHLMVTNLCFITFCFSFAGFFVPYRDMEDWLKWTEHANPFTYIYYTGMHIYFSWGPTSFTCGAGGSVYEEDCVDGHISRHEILTQNGVNKSAGFCVGVLIALTITCHTIAYRLVRNDYTLTIRSVNSVEAMDDSNVGVNGKTLAGGHEPIENEHDASLATIKVHDEKASPHDSFIIEPEALHINGVASNPTVVHGEPKAVRSSDFISVSMM